jgi:hypothetical protein
VWNGALKASGFIYLRSYDIIVVIFVFSHLFVKSNIFTSYRLPYKFKPLPDWANGTRIAIVEVTYFLEVATNELG